ncbi:MAG: YraN family protein [Proteobacteria bacterium]|nr:MAG: YraN family protein [Pseudomonadota bacterium]
MTKPHYTRKHRQSVTQRQIRGDSEEQRACEYLQSQGLELIAQNFSCRMGEIDLIMHDPEKNNLVFVEVRYRVNSTFGGAAASITRSKQRRIIRTALHYQQKYAPKSYMRFDVVAIEGDNQLQWFPAAFYGF